MNFILHIAVLIFLAKCVFTQIITAKCGPTKVKNFAYQKLTNETFPAIIPNFRNVSSVIINFPNCNVETVSVNTFYNYPDIGEIRLSENYIEDLIVETFDRNFNLEILMLDGNILKKLKNGILANHNNLKSLFLQNNKIDYIHKNVFTDTVSLETLNLACNKLEILNKNLFQQNINLKYLNIASNSIIYLERTIFAKLTQLEKLYLNNNKITYIHKDLFENLSSLIKLELSYNHISNWQLDFFYKNTKLAYLWINDNSMEKKDAMEEHHIKHLTILNNLKVETTIQTIIGSSETLSCRIKDFTTLNDVYWLKNESMYVQEEFETLGKRFSKTSKNIYWHNLTIHNITKEDEGIYTCISDEENPSKTYVKLVVLKVLSKNRETKQENQGSGFYIALICCVVCLILIIIFIIIYMKYRKLQKINSKAQKKRDERNAAEPSFEEIDSQPMEIRGDDQYAYAYIEPNEVTPSERKHPLTSRNFSKLEREVASS